MEADINSIQNQTITPENSDSTTQMLSSIDNRIYFLLWQLKLAERRAEEVPDNVDAIVQEFQSCRRFLTTRFEFTIQINVTSTDFSKKLNLLGLFKIRPSDTSLTTDQVIFTPANDASIWNALSGEGYV